MPFPSVGDVIHASAPVRVCDLGGWTDTWFAQHGQVLNIAVTPRVEVQIRTSARTEQSPRVTMHADNYEETWHPDLAAPGFDRHPLLEACLAFTGLPDRIAVEIAIFSECPGGASTGTSAAVSVALLAALDRLTPGRMDPMEIARSAQRVETELLSQQCGIQDQIASAFGGISFIDMHEYPYARVEPVQLRATALAELENRLSLIYVGLTHNSSATHEMVIRRLEAEGSAATDLQPLRRTPGEGRNALENGDFGAFGRVMTANTEAQRALHPDLIGPRHQQIIPSSARIWIHGHTKRTSGLHRRAASTGSHQQCAPPPSHGPCNSGVS